jgi:GNAT superfamily N-acetyltransferase
MMHARIARTGDAEAAVDVLKRSITELCVIDHRNDAATLQQWLSNKTVENFLAWIGSLDNFCVVTEDEAGVNGVGMLNRRGEIQLCYVSPDTQRRGCGAAILAALEEQAAKWALPRVHLASTEGACAFYEKHGFRPGGESTCGFGVTRCYPYEKNLGP